MIKPNHKKGSFSSFLAIILTSVTILMTVLTKAASIRSDETLLTGILIGQLDLLLSQYSEKLLDWYGIYATALADDEAEAFQRASARIFPLEHYSCAAREPLETQARLKEAILAFAGPRVPVQMTLQLAGRFSQIQEMLASCKKQSAEESVQEEEKGPLFETEDPWQKRTVDYETIVNLLRLVDKDLFNKSMTEQTQNSAKNPDQEAPITWESLEECLKNDRENPSYNTKASQTIKSSLCVTEKTIQDLSSFLEPFYEIESGVLYQKLCFQWYTGSMFSCKVNSRIQNGLLIERKDLRNRNLSALPVVDRFELEKIIFNSETSEKNEFYAKSAIEAVRFVFHLICNLTDKTKKAEIQAAAAALCALTALVSGGTVAVPQEAMETVALLLVSMDGASRDYQKLSIGEGLPVLPTERFKDVKTYYADYLQLFLLMIPENEIAARMIKIIKNNLFLTGTPLYTALSVSAEYRGKKYRIEGQYDGYGTDKTEEQKGFQR